VAAPATVLHLHSSAGLYGADVQLALIVRHLDPDRYRSVVVLPFEGELEAELRATGATVIVQNLAVLRRRHLNPAGLAQLAVRTRRDRSGLAEIAHREDARLIHANTSVILGALPAARAAGLPLVQHVREIYDAGGPVWPVFRRRLQRASALVCVSKATAAQFSRAQTIHDGLPRAPLRSDPGPARAALGLEGSAFAVGVAGRISSWKGQDLLARALAEASLRDIGAMGVIAGDPFPGEERHQERLLALAAELGVSGRLRLVGFRRDVETVLSACDAMCVPSTRPDPFPNSALEAAAAGCAVVAANHGGAPEIVEDGRTGLLFEPSDHRALADTLAKLAADPGLRARLGSAAAKEVPARFTPEATAARLQDVFDRVLDDQ
jgi:glycosyltransferase involved in cell wall biosynthesis